MSLSQVFCPECIILDLESIEKNKLFEELIANVVSVFPDVDYDEALAAIMEREAKMSTGIMHDIAVPHGSSGSVKQTIGVIGVSRKGIEYDSLDKSPVHFVFMLLSSSNETEQHLSVLRDLASVLQNPSFIKELSEKQSRQEAYDLLCKYEMSVSM